MKNRSRSSAALASAALAVGCMSVGHPFDYDKVERISVRNTTRDEIHRWFGDPWRTGLEDGQRTWTYGHYKYRLIGTTETRDLVVRYDQNGIVSSYTFNAAPPLSGSY